MLRFVLYHGLSGNTIEKRGTFFQNAEYPSFSLWFFLFKLPVVRRLFDGSLHHLLHLPHIRLNEHSQYVVGGICRWIRIVETIIQFSFFHSGSPPPFPACPILCRVFLVYASRNSILAPPSASRHTEVRQPASVRRGLRTVFPLFLYEFIPEILDGRIREAALRRAGRDIDPTQASLSLQNTSGP